MLKTMANSIEVSLVVNGAIDDIVKASFIIYQQTHPPGRSTACEKSGLGAIKILPDGRLCSSATLYENYLTSRREGIRPLQALTGAIQQTIPQECPIREKAGNIFERLDRLSDLLPLSPTPEGVLISTVPAAVPGLIYQGSELLQRYDKGESTTGVALAAASLLVMALACKSMWNDCNKPKDTANY